MNIKQLRDYLDALLTAGMDPHTPVCIPADDEAYELSDSKLISGPFREDPAPKMPAFIFSHGTFVLFQTSDDYEWLGNQRYREVDGPEVPCKEWKPGEEWWLKTSKSVPQP